MPHLRSVAVAPTILLCVFFAACSRPATPSGSQPAESAETTTPPGTADIAETPESDSQQGQDLSMEETDAEHLYAGGAHADHNSKHGGTFFMALDNRHHLEGALERPGVFRVYIYDVYTKPVSAEELSEVQAKVIWGEQDGAPEIDLKPNADNTALEAKPPAAVRFPVTLTLLVRFPGAAAGSRAELFTFPFSHYSHIDTTPHEHPVGQ